MTILTDYRDPVTDDIIWGCGGFIERHVTRQDYWRAMHHWFPLLAPIPSLRHARAWERFAAETITPWVWLSMPVHDERGDI